MIGSEYIPLLGPSGFSQEGVLASIPASGLLYVRCPAGREVQKVDWLLQGDRNHAYQFYRCHVIPASLATVTIAGWLTTETILLMGNTYTGNTSVTTWSTKTISIAGTDAQDAALLQKAINGGKVVTCTTADATGNTVTVNGIVFTGGAAESLSTRVWHADSANATTAATSLAACINDATYGVSGVTATLGAGTGEVLIQTTADYDNYPTVTSSNGTNLAISTIGETYISADISSNVLTLKWRNSLVDRAINKAPTFFFGKTGTATTHAAFTDELLKSLQIEAAQVTGKTTNATSAGNIYTATPNGAAHAYLAVTNSDGSNPMITRVGAYRVPFVAA